MFWYNWPVATEFMNNKVQGLTTQQQCKLILILIKQTKINKIYEWFNNNKQKIHWLEHTKHYTAGIDTKIKFTQKLLV
jgi:hypothetical protein